MAPPCSTSAGYFVQLEGTRAWAGGDVFHDVSEIKRAWDRYITIWISSKSEPGREASSYGTYTFTDISPSFFEKARDRFADQGDHMIFKTLDIEKAPVEQGFTPGSYDLVIASNVLHATATLADTLRHVRSLLKPGARLVLIEVTNMESSMSNAIWGTLPGWWRATEDNRQQGPLCTALQWAQNLRQNGFTDLELHVPNHSEPAHQTLSLKARSSREAQPVDIALFLKAEEVQHCDIVDYTSIANRNVKFDVCVSLIELEGSLLSSMQEADLASLKNITEFSNQIFWITSRTGSTPEIPEGSMVSGFSRAITQEQPGLRFVTIEVREVSEVVNTFRNIYQSARNIVQSVDFESDYMPEDTTILIPRVIEPTEINEQVHSQVGRPEMVRKTVPENDKEALELRFATGHIDSVYFAKDDTAYKPLRDDEVEIRVCAAPVNFTDVMIVPGQMAGESIGCECAGIVHRIIATVTTLSVGDRVCYTGIGMFKTFVRGKEYSMIRIPDALPFTDVFPWAGYAMSSMKVRNPQGSSLLVDAEPEPSPARREPLPQFGLGVWIGDTTGQEGSDILGRPGAPISFLVPACVTRCAGSPPQLLAVPYGPPRPHQVTQRSLGARASRPSAKTPAYCVAEHDTTTLPTSRARAAREVDEDNRRRRTSSWAPVRVCALTAVILELRAIDIPTRPGATSI
ncbi:hypothetical protein F4778DRAFT_783560 [Xylariomycetidae sp. FL2044]|nr:hypothetical protein F4778DRAFT_783560 [Xylariomycetidae sp. FL2044]